MTHEDPPPPVQTAGVAGAGMGAAGGSAGGIMGGLGLGAAPTPVVKAAPPKGPQKVSSCVIAGSKISGANPVYPPIAKAAHVSGAVVLHAIISKQGTIQSLTVVSGPEMLRNSATEAVQNWRYRPYILNGEPTEVDTTITVNFNFGS